MTMVVTIAMAVEDWAALRVVNEALVARARELRASRYCLLRNSRDAARALLVAEVPDEETAQEFERDVVTLFHGHTTGDDPDDGVWETTGLDGVGGD